MTICSLWNLAFEARIIFTWSMSSRDGASPTHRLVAELNRGKSCCCELCDIGGGNPDGQRNTGKRSAGPVGGVARARQGHLSTGVVRTRRLSWVGRRLGTPNSGARIHEPVP